MASVAGIAALAPSASEVEICWETVTNKAYKVQYRSDLTTNAWTDLTGTNQGSCGTMCIRDPVPAGQPQRFYRVTTVP